MTTDKQEPTLGRYTPGAGGFNKKPTPVVMQVDANEVKDMQRGYEMRIARQRDAITRLQALLVAQVERFEQWMRAEIETTAQIDESHQAPVLAVAGGGVIDDTELDELLKLLPEDYDFYNEDDTARTIIAGYIRHLQTDNENQRGKQTSLVKYQQAVTELTQLMGSRIKPWLIQGHGVSSAVAAYVTQVEQERDQARTDASHNARQANQALQVVDADDTPPWMKTEPQAFVQPATVGAAGVWSNEPPSEISTTITDWAGGTELPPGEDRPGNSF